MTFRRELLNHVTQSIQQAIERTDLPSLSSRLGLAVATLALVSPLASVAQTATAFVQNNIVSSDASVKPLQVDARMANSWGLAPGKAFWIDNPGSGFSLIVDKQAAPQSPQNAAIPNPAPVTRFPIVPVNLTVK